MMESSMDVDVGELSEDELDDVDPSFLCVLTTRSLDETKQAAALLRNHGYVVQVSSELVADALIATTVGAPPEDVAHTLWVAGSQAEAAASLLASHGYESEIEGRDLVTEAKPWAKTYNRLHALVALTLLVGMVLFAFWALLQF